jgi:hypothetical protein
MERGTPERAGAIAAVAALAFFLMAMSLSKPGLHDWYLLAKTGRDAQAKVVRFRPEYHQSCDFEFQVGSETHTGSMSGCRAHVGDHVHVLFVPAAPWFASMADPINQLVGMIFGAFLMSVVAGVVVGLRIRSGMKGPAMSKRGA